MKRPVLIITFCVCFLTLVIVPTTAQTSSIIERVSVASNSAQANDSSSSSVISSDGRYVAFFSYANNLVANDTNNTYDIFVRDRQTGQTTRVSVASNGAQANDSSYNPSISGDGRYVAFYSSANNLVANDTNNASDIFVRDRQTGQTTRVSVASGSIQANSDSDNPSISNDGRYVAFDSFSSNLVANDTNNTYDIFVYDRQTGQTTRVSVASGGIQADNTSYDAFISS